MNYNKKIKFIIILYKRKYETYFLISLTIFKDYLHYFKLSKIK